MLPLLEPYEGYLGYLVASPVLLAGVVRPVW